MIAPVGPSPDGERLHVSFSGGPDRPLTSGAACIRSALASWTGGPESFDSLAEAEAAMCAHLLGWLNGTGWLLSGEICDLVRAFATSEVVDQFEIYDLLLAELRVQEL